MAMKVLSMNRVESDEDKVTLNVVVKEGDDRKTLSIPSTHARWDEIQEAVEAYMADLTPEGNEALAETIIRLMVPVREVGKRLIRVQGLMQGRMTLQDNKLFVDGDPMDPALEGHILRMVREDGSLKGDRNWNAFARFVENLYSNVNEHVRQQLFGWLSYENTYGRGFTITADGCFIGYKGCAGTAEEPVSRHRGPAVVDGVPMNGAIPNKPGSIIELARSQVQFDPAVGCASGLHVGTYAYASGWARGVLVTVKVNPRDVVSVPTECEAQKIRTCRYEVLEVTEQKYEGTTWDEEDWDEDEGDECACHACTCEDHSCEECEDYGSDCQDCGDGEETLSVFPEAGDRGVITYRKLDGKVKDYLVEVLSEDSEHLNVELQDGTQGYRTFLRRGVVAWQPEAPAEAPVEEAPVEEEAPVQEDTSTMKIEPKAVAVGEGTQVRLTYRKADGSTTSYEVTVTKADAQGLEGTLSAGGYRRFNRANIVALEVITSQEAAAQEGKQEGVNPQPRPITGDKVLDKFIGDGLNALLKAFMDES